MITKDYRVPKSSIRGLDDEAIFWTVIEPIWPATEADDTLEHISEGTPGQRALYATTLFMREVDNGGLEQFFWNGGGIYSIEVLKGFQLLGMNLNAELVKKAFSFFPNSQVPLDWVERQRYLLSKGYNLSRGSHQVDQAKAFFEPINEQLYGEEKLFPYYKKYIEAHSEEFFLNED
jgi:hypothetical protein